MPGAQMLAMNGLGGGGRGSPAPGLPHGSAPLQRGSLELGGGLSGGLDAQQQQQQQQQQQRGGLGLAGSLGTGGGFGIADMGLRAGGGGPGGSQAARGLGGPGGGGGSGSGLHASGDLMSMLDGSGSQNSSMAAAAGGKFSQAAGRQVRPDRAAPDLAKLLLAQQVAFCHAAPHSRLQTYKQHKIASRALLSASPAPWVPS